MPVTTGPHAWTFNESGRGGRKKLKVRRAVRNPTAVFTCVADAKRHQTRPTTLYMVMEVPGDVRDTWDATADELVQHLADSFNFGQWIS